MDQTQEPPSRTDENKVIHIFQRHRRGEDLHFAVEEGGELIVTPDGFNYVTFREDKPLTNGNGHAPEDEYLEPAHKKHYIFKFLENHKEHFRLDNYYVPGERLMEFLLSIDKRPGQLLEIKPFIPDLMG